jgi:hypothetical protein
VPRWSDLRTRPYRVLQQHLAARHAGTPSGRDGGRGKAGMEREFRRCLAYGILPIALPVPDVPSVRVTSTSAVPAARRHDPTAAAGPRPQAVTSSSITMASPSDERLDLVQPIHPQVRGDNLRRSRQSAPAHRAFFRIPRSSGVRRSRGDGMPTGFARIGATPSKKTTNLSRHTHSKAENFS